MKDTNQADFLLLRKTTEAISPVSDESWELFAAAWKPFRSERKQILCRPGDTEKYLYFVLDGIQRVYYADDSGKEATIVFSFSPSFGGVIDAFLLHQPSKYYYETLTPSRFLKISFSELNQLMESRSDIEFMIRKGLTLAFSGVLDRLVELQTFSSEEKFKQLLKRSPHILQLVPQKYLANYLGIDATNFSKLINKVKI